MLCVNCAGEWIFLYLVCNLCLSSLRLVFLGVINGGFLFHSIQITSPPFLCHKNNKDVVRAMKNLEWNVAEREKSRRGRPAKGGRGSYSVC